MKNLITLLLIIISMNLFSQVEKPITKGNFLIGGSASGGYYSQKYTYSSSSTANTTSAIDASLYPSIGYFIIDGLAVGLSLNASISEGLKENKYSSLGFGLGPFIKYYTPIGLFVGSKFNYSLSSAKFDSKKFYNDNSINVSPEVGYAYFINSKVAIETSLNYSFYLSNRTFANQSQNPDDSNKYNRLYFSLGFQIFL